MKELDKKTRAAPTVCLEQRERVLGGNRFVYRILLQPSSRNTYFLQVVAGEDGECTVSVGEDLVFAVALFALLVRNVVSPCHLEDVIADLEAEEVFEENFSLLF